MTEAPGNRSSAAKAAVPRQRVVVKRRMRKVEVHSSSESENDRKSPPSESSSSEAEEDGSACPESDSDGHDSTSESDSRAELEEQIRNKRQRVLKLKVSSTATRAVVTSAAATAHAQALQPKQVVTHSGSQIESIASQSDEVAAAHARSAGDALFELGAANADAYTVFTKAGYSSQGVQQRDTPWAKGDMSWKKAKEIWEQAAQHGHAEAQNGLGWIHFWGKNQSKALEMWELAADLKSANAQYNLGVAYTNDDQGVRVDMAKGTVLLGLAAKQGHADAQYTLGCVLWNGEGVLADRKKAVELFQLAADQGHSGGKCNLGCAYYFGQGADDGVPMNKAKGAALWLEAAKQGNEHARFNRQVLDAEEEAHQWRAWQRRNFGWRFEQACRDAAAPASSFCLMAPARPARRDGRVARFHPTRRTLRVQHDWFPPYDCGEFTELCDASWNKHAVVQ